MGSSPRIESKATVRLSASLAWSRSARGAPLPSTCRTSAKSTAIQASLATGPCSLAALAWSLPHSCVHASRAHLAPGQTGDTAARGPLVRRSNRSLVGPFLPHPSGSTGVTRLADALNPVRRRKPQRLRCTGDGQRNWTWQLDVGWKWGGGLLGGT